VVVKVADVAVASVVAAGAYVQPDVLVVDGGGVKQSGQAWLHK